MNWETPLHVYLSLYLIAKDTQRHFYNCGMSAVLTQEEKMHLIKKF